MIAYSYFLQGGPFGMGLLTLLLIGLCIAAWKAPAWVISASELSFFRISYAHHLAGYHINMRKNP